MTKTRLAPSPTGALHLGNARTFLLTWLYARAQGLALHFRLEDLDGPRKKPGAGELVFEDLRWLGIDWDGPVVVQSERIAVHRAALAKLAADGLVYACSCARRDLEAAQGAPHAEDELHYPGTCRGRFASVEQAYAASGRPVALRFRTPPGLLSFPDTVAGEIAIDPSMRGGDFVVGRFDPQSGVLPGYQLAVVVDDAEAGVDLVVRGDDLLPSTPRQMLLQRVLGLPTPHYAHVPLVVGDDGRRLAKRHGDTRLSAYREAGIPAERIREWAAATIGRESSVFTAPRGSGFELAGVPRQRIVVPPHRTADGPPVPARFTP